jgi:hypothetical protein
MRIPVKYKSNLEMSLNSLGPDDLWYLRGNLHILKKYLSQQSQNTSGQVLNNIDRLLNVSSELLTFFENIKGSITAADFNKMARFFNAAGDTISEFEEIISKEDFKIHELVMESLSVLFNYTGNTAYISSALENCETHVRTNSIIIYDRLWELVTQFKEDASEDEMSTINSNMNTFFSQFGQRNTSLPDRITILTRLYQFICIIYLTRIIADIKWIDGD